MTGVVVRRRKDVKHTETARNLARSSPFRVFLDLSNVIHGASSFAAHPSAVLHKIGISCIFTCAPQILICQAIINVLRSNFF